VDGAFRFLNRTWRIVMDYCGDISSVDPCDDQTPLAGELKNFRRKIHQTIRKVSSDIEGRFHFNTAISAVMELVNTLYLLERPAKEDRIGLSVVREAIEVIVLMLAPIVPHISQELWAKLGKKKPLLFASWPIWDEAVIAAEEMTIVVQVNGKVRGRIVVPVDETAETIQSRALADEKVARFIEGKSMVKQIYVPGKLVNIVIRG
jgi:leucyl-tRNA synthetase